MKTFLIVGTDVHGKQSVICDPCEYALADAVIDEITDANGAFEGGQFALVQMFPINARAAHKRRKFKGAPVDDAPVHTDEDVD